MNASNVQEMLLVLLAAFMWAMLIPSAVWLLADDEALSKVRALFQPQWKREADFLARNIPTGDSWS